ncbi:hypothetical protein CHS0354_002044 [Potamilus streckersoni]|uniref:Pyridine nucleotide-disulfide oxidoreductase n=1 Tax=Potamilus streckersoni TaxID=2493646 RepID=A0AAE0T5Q1_9BIVA|nr:hypothetical protein CHS0354_002044 [Potamilus streckersoni]
MKKLLLLVLIFAAVIAFFALGLHEILTPEGIRNIRPTVREWIDTYTWQIYIAFFVMYVLIAALSLPGALIMTLSAGAFFGLLWGTVLVSFGSSVGALLAFLSSRLLLRDFVTKRFGQRLGAVNKGVKEDGALYLFVLRLVPKRRVYAKWKRPKRYDRNMIVIGSGAAGLVTTYIAAAVKAKVTMIEAHKMGGDCLNYGCVPSKALIASAKTVYQIKHAGEYGVSSSEPSVLFKEVVHRVHNVIAKIAPHDSVERYTSLGAEVIQGYAKLVDPWTVEIKLNAGGTQRLTARSIVIAAGAAPFVPDLPGLKEVGYLTSDTLWDTLLTCEELPGRIVIMGGGPIGCELAQCFARLGADVTQIERNPRIMMREDEEVSKMAADALKADGVNILTEYTVIRCEKARRR